MKLERPLIFLDIESATANPHKPDPQQDRIIEIAARKYFQIDADKPWHESPVERSQVFDPGIEINDECSKIHGWTNEHMKNGKFPLFSENASGWLEFIGQADLAGFGIWYYDLPLLVAEFDRCKLSLCWRSRQIIDAGIVFRLKEERTLTAAAKFYCNLEHTDAHGAEADTKMAVEVFKAQLQRYPDLAAMPLPELHKFCQFDERLTLDGKIAKGPDGDPIYTFGKVKGTKVKDDLGFADWMLYKASFPRDTREWLEAYKLQLEEERQFKSRKYAAGEKHDQDDMFA